MSQKKAQPKTPVKRVLPVATSIAGDSETLFTLDFGHIWIAGEQGIL